MKKTLRLWILVSLLLSASVLFAQEKTYDFGLIGFYNLENLFDTIDDPETNDAEYLPNGKNNWGTMKYQHKLKNLSEVIAKIGTDELVAKYGVELRCPDILGVSEIENRSVLEDLISQPALAPYNFGIVHFDGPDMRGVDVGLIYQKDKFEVTGTRSVRLNHELLKRPTRDQLVVTGNYMGNEIHIIVNHWPSRLGGEAKSSPLREAAAALSRAIVDSILEKDPNAKVILMGDLNDDPYNKSVVVEMNAPKTDNYKELKPGQMYNASWGAYKRGNGTLCYRGKWNLFDQILITQGFLTNEPGSLRFHGYRIFNDPMLLQKSGSYAGYPLRTHAGGSWLDGYSDHFPVFMVVRKAK